MVTHNRGLPDEKATRYRELTKRRQDGVLTPGDHRELLDLSDEVERLEAKRIEHLANLARLRGKPLGALMEELGIRPSSNTSTWGEWEEHPPTDADAFE